MIDLHKYDIICDNPKKPVYEKRYKKNGEEYLKKVDEIDIEEDMAEKRLEIDRIKEILNNQERVRTEDLLNQMTEEEINELENLTELNDIDTYEFLNKTNELKEIYNKMPENIKSQYNNLAKFGKEYLPQFINEQKDRIENQKNEQKLNENQTKINNTYEELQKQIEELQAKINKGDSENV